MKGYYWYRNGQKMFYDDVVSLPPTWLVQHHMTMVVEPATNFRLKRVNLSGTIKVDAVWEEVTRGNGRKKQLIKNQIAEIQPDMGVEITRLKGYNKPVTRYVVNEVGAIEKVQ